MAKQYFKYYEVENIDSIRELMENANKNANDKTAFKYKTKEGQKEATYGEFYLRTCYLGTALANMGVTGFHIACIGENSYDWLTSYLTVLMSKGVFVPVDKELPLDDIANVLNNSDAKVIFASDKYEEKLRLIEDRLPDIDYVICFDRAYDDGKYLSFSNLIEKGKVLYDSGNRDYTEEKSDEYELKLLVYTSGTTGLAKGVMLTEHNIVSCIKYGLEVSTVYTTCLSVLPYHHTYEAVAGILVALHSHATICINDSMGAILKNMKLYQPDYIYLVPAFAEVFYKKIWENAEKNNRARSLRAAIKSSRALRKVGIDARAKLFASVHSVFGGKLKKIVCGGAPIRPEIGEFFDDIGIPLVNGYGITECSPLVSVNPDSFNDPSTVGIHLRCVELRFEDIDDEGNGEICVKGDTVMKGYYDNPEETNKVLMPDGWFHTGDFGRINEKGQLLITGRKKNLIVLKNGKNIYPEEIENYILAIPYVKEGVVYASTNEAGEEVSLLAEVFLDEEELKRLDITDPQEKLKEDIKEATAELPVYKQISKIVIRQVEFEKTTTNKIKRQCINKQ